MDLKIYLPKLSSIEIKASAYIGSKLDVMASADIQNLFVMAYYLEELNGEIAAYLARPLDEDGKPSFALPNALFMSYLWILGTYEVVRALRQRVKESPEKFTDDVAKIVDETCSFLTRIRVPLAKYEASGKYRNEDVGVAFPIAIDGGIGWALNGRDAVMFSEIRTQICKFVNCIGSSAAAGVYEVHLK